MEKTFDGKVAIVTGGSIGIGGATAIAFTKRGAKVVVADWVEDKENETIKQIKSMGGTAAFVQCDVSSASEVSDMIEKTISMFGRGGWITLLIMPASKGIRRTPMNVQKKTGIKQLALT